MKEVSLKRDGKWILQNVNWDIEKGENWVLFGLNGSGKTALLNMINAYYFPTRGQVSVLGMEFGKTPLAEFLRSKIGFVSSSISEKFYRNDNAFEIVLSGAFASIGLYETPTDEMRQKAIRLLEDMGCINYANQKFDVLSQGERQRVLIARALMADPSLLILDEPTNGLDFIAREYLLDAISRLSDTPTAPTIIYVTHHAEEILPCFQKTLLLKQGEVFSSGETKDMISNEQLTKFFDLAVNVYWDGGRPLLSKVNEGLKYV